MHREEAFAVINYLWKNSPFYIDIPPQLDVSSTALQTEQSSSTTERSSSTSTSTSSRINSAQQTQPQQQQGHAQQQQNLTHYEVDTERSKNVVRMLEETQRIGAATTQQLHQQGMRTFETARVDRTAGEQLKSADNKLDSIDAQVVAGLSTGA